MANNIPQRRSIFSGVLLILIGILFLFHRYHPGLEVWRLFGRYWPILLIVWGLAKLIDHLRIQRTGEGGVRIVTGGEMALILLLLFAVGGIAVLDWAHRRGVNLNPGGGWPWPGSTITTTEEFPARAIGTGSLVDISTENGNIIVLADEATDLRVVANKSGTAANESEARKIAEGIRIAVNPVGGGYEIREQGPGEDNGKIRVDFELHVPKQVSIAARSARGDLDVSDVGGGVNVSTENGDIEIHDAGGDANASVQRGNVRISGANGNVRISGHGDTVELSDVGGGATVEGDFYGPIRIHNVKARTSYSSAGTELTALWLSGRLEMDSETLELSDVGGNISLSTHNRDIQIENAGGRLQIVGTHGDIQVRYEHPPQNDIAISNDSGGVDLTMPENSAFEISAVSKGGEIRSDFEDPALVLTNDNDMHKLTGKIGTHGPKINIVTTYGTISLRKGA